MFQPAPAPAIYPVGPHQSTELRFPTDPDEPTWTEFTDSELCAMLPEACDRMDSAYQADGSSDEFLYWLDVVGQITRAIFSSMN